MTAGLPPYTVWLDVRDIRPGVDWDTQIRDAIQTCQSILFLMTADSVQDYSGCKLEWSWALKYKKTVIPLRVDPTAESPFRLFSRQYIDFSGSFDVGLARLRTYLSRVGSPEWVLEDLKNQLTEAERALPRSDAEQRLRVVQDMEELHKTIADQTLLLADPESATLRTEERIAAAMEKERQLGWPANTGTHPEFVNAPPMVAPSYFQDRYLESELLGDFLQAANARIMTVVGRGGSEKQLWFAGFSERWRVGDCPMIWGNFQFTALST